MKYVLTTLLCGVAFWLGAAWHAGTRPTTHPRQVANPLYAPVITDCLITAQMCKKAKKTQL